MIENLSTQLGGIPPTAIAIDTSIGRHTKEFSLSRFLATLPIPLFMIMSSLFMPYVGKFLDKGEIRSILITGALVYGLSLISLYFVFSWPYSALKAVQSIR